MSDISISLTQPETISVTVEESEIQVTLSQPEDINITLSQAQGVAGVDAQNIEIQNNGTHIQWKKEEDVLWTDIVAIADLKGEQGLQGIQGFTGSQGLPGNDGYTPVKGVDYFDGIDGSAGSDGAEVELQNTGIYIQWRYTDGEWTNLIAVADLKGEQGLQGIQGVQGNKGDKGDTGSQGLQGDAGPQGIQGIQGIQGTAGTNGTNGTDGAAGMSRFTFILHRGENATAGLNKTNVIVVERACSINKAYAYAKTAPTGAALIFDINVNGSTIWATQANRLQIAAAANSGIQTSFDTTSLAENDLITIDIDQIGSTLPGADITVVLKVV